MTKEVQVAILRACARFVTKKLTPAEKRIEALEKKLKDLGGLIGRASELRGFDYAGNWQASRAAAEGYTKGDFCTYKGGLWACLRETSSCPGDNNRDWQLAVRGVDR